MYKLIFNITHYFIIIFHNILYALFVRGMSLYIYLFDAHCILVRIALNLISHDFAFAVTKIRKSFNAG